MYRLLPLVFLVACGSDATDQTVADYQAVIADMRTLVTDHAAAVDAATTMDEVTPMEATYQTDWAAMSSRMGDQMSTIETCDMSDADMGMMNDTTAMMGDMDGMIADHVAAHADHADMAACIADEDTLTTSMNERMDTMMAHGDAWRTSMHCSGTMGM